MPAAIASLLLARHVAGAEIAVSLVAIAVCVTLLVQATTAGWLARRLGLLDAAPARRSWRLRLGRLVHLRERQRRALGAGREQGRGERLAAQRGAAALRDVSARKRVSASSAAASRSTRRRDGPRLALVAAVAPRLDHGVERCDVALGRRQQLGAQIVRARVLGLEPASGESAQALAISAAAIAPVVHSAMPAAGSGAGDARL